MASERPPRRCTECREAQRLTRATTDYPESGLDNVKLVDVPVWECGNGHQEVEIPKAEQLHGLLVNTLISKPAAKTRRAAAAGTHSVRCRPDRILG